MDSHARFSRAVDSLFKRLGLEADYLHPSDPPQTILVIPRRPEQLLELGEGRIHAEDPQLEFRVSEIPNPQRGDEIVLQGRTYRLEAEPRLEQHHLVWVVDTLPV